MNNLLEKTRSQNKRLEGERIYLEPFSEKHLSEKYVGWFNDPVVCQFNRHGQGDYTEAKARQYLQTIKDSDRTIVFAICIKGPGIHIGNISINDIDWTTCTGEISILIGEKQYWGKGFGKEAVKQVMDYGFNILSLHCLWMGMTVNNRGMIRIAEELGFREERILRNVFIKNGVSLDITEWTYLNSNDSRGTL